MGVTVVSGLLSCFSRVLMKAGNFHGQHAEEFAAQSLQVTVFSVFFCDMNLRIYGSYAKCGIHYIYCELQKQLIDFFPNTHITYLQVSKLSDLSAWS